MAPDEEEESEHLYIFACPITDRNVYMLHMTGCSGSLVSRKGLSKEIQKIILFWRGSAGILIATFHPSTGQVWQEGRAPGDCERRSLKENGNRGCMHVLGAELLCAGALSQPLGQHDPKIHFVFFG
jgi:hypothetical protein